MSDIRYPDVHVRLSGTDGNSFAVMGRVQQALKQEGVPADEVNEYLTESMSGDYEHLLATAARWVSVS